ncbi:hypothetical protein EB796_001028 [Bugula neritina]|uniref:Uncharacterized protein n=1 Tax=Bugula neritina TaxID=10212 RepID=A0A7J7KR93_BUGNE|nr:hypothetical protein EB796_001028 [Bugula neritina]
MYTIKIQHKQVRWFREKVFEMCCYLLFTSDHNNSAIDYLSWLISYETSWFSILQHNRQIAECMNKLSKYKSARNILIRVKSTLEEKLMIDKNKSLTEYILRKVENSTGLPEYLLPMFQITSDLFCSLAHPDLTDVISSIIDIYLEYKRYEDCLFLCYTPVLRNQCLSKVLNGISTDYIRSSNYRRAAQFLQIAISKAADHSMEQADNYHQMGRCYMLMSSYKKSWCWLYSALCLYQSLPKTREVIFSLGKVHLSIAHLLLHTGHIVISLTEWVNFVQTVKPSILYNGEESFLNTNGPVFHIELDYHKRDGSLLIGTNKHLVSTDGLQKTKLASFLSKENKRLVFKGKYDVRCHMIDYTNYRRVAIESTLAMRRAQLQAICEKRMYIRAHY